MKSYGRGRIKLAAAPPFLFGTKNKLNLNDLLKSCNKAHKLVFKMRKLFCQVHFRALKSVYTIKNKRVGSLYHRTRSYASAADALPRVVHPSFWQLIVPKFIRERKRNAGQIKDPKSREWNPATFYIVIFLLIGSNAIQMIALRNDYAVFSRKADAKISLLKEVLERVHRGEDVDVKGLLGTGDEEQEKEWEEG